MPTFRDGSGREWVVTIDGWQLRVVRERTGFELGKLLQDGCRRWEELAADPVLFGSVLFALCDGQVKERHLGEEQFHRMLAGDAIAAAFDAFEQAYLDFCPSQQRALLRAVMEKGAAAGDLGRARAMEQIRAIDPETLLTSNGPSGGSPASPGSTPAPAG